MASAVNFVLHCLSFAALFHGTGSCIAGFSPCHIRNVKPIPVRGAVNIDPQRCDADGRDGQICSLPRRETFRILQGACPAQIFFDNVGVDIPPGGIIIQCMDDGTNRATGEGLKINRVSEISCACFSNGKAPILGTQTCNLTSFKPLSETGILGIEAEVCTANGAAQVCRIPNGKTFAITDIDACPGQIFFDDNAFDIPLGGIRYTCDNGVNKAVGDGVNQTGFGSISCGTTPCALTTFDPLPATGVFGIRPDVCTANGQAQVCRIPNGESFAINDVDACPGQIFFDDNNFDIPLGGVRYTCNNGVNTVAGSGINQTGFGSISCGTTPCVLTAFDPLPVTGLLGLEADVCTANGVAQVCRIPNGESFAINDVNACPGQIFFDENNFDIPLGGIRYSCNNGVNTAVGDSLRQTGFGSISCGTTPCELTSFRPLSETGIIGIRADVCTANGEAQVCQIPNGESFTISDVNSCPGQIFFDDNPLDIPAGGIQYTCNNAVNTATGTGFTNQVGFGSISCGRKPCRIVNRSPLPSTGISGLDAFECMETGVGLQCMLANGEEYNIAADACNPGTRIFLDENPFDLPANGVNMVCLSDGTMEARDAGGSGSVIQTGVQQTACGSGQLGLTPIACNPTSGLSTDQKAQVCTLEEASEFRIDENTCENEQELFIMSNGGTTSLNIPATGLDFQCLDGKIEARDGTTGIATDVTSLTCGYCQALVRGLDDMVLFPLLSCDKGNNQELCDFSDDSIITNPAPCPLTTPLTGIWSIRQANGDCITFQPFDPTNLITVGIELITGFPTIVNHVRCADNGNVEVTVIRAPPMLPPPPILPPPLTFHNVVQIQCGACPL